MWEQCSIRLFNCILGGILAYCLLHTTQYMLYNVYFFFFFLLCSMQYVWLCLEFIKCKNKAECISLQVSGLNSMDLAWTVLYVQLELRAELRQFIFPLQINNSNHLMLVSTTVFLTIVWCCIQSIYIIDVYIINILYTYLNYIAFFIITFIKYYIILGYTFFNYMKAYIQGSISWNLSKYSLSDVGFCEIYRINF